MKHLSILLAFLLLFVYGGSGQTTTLSGIVLDSASRRPMPYVLLEVSDTANANVGGGITDSLGRYALGRIPQKPLILRASTTGYRTKLIPVNPKEKRTELAPILLALDTIAIADVRVLGKAPELTLRPNRQEIRLQQADVKAGIPLSEMLARLPDFKIDPQSGLLLRDKGFTLLINGRPSHISPNEINTIDPATIERIEVITNPTVSQRASMQGGIINIIVKNPKPGFNAVLQALGGINNYYKGTFTANVAIPKFNFFVSLYGNYDGVLYDLVNTTTAPDGSFVHSVNSITRNDNWYIPPKIGFEYLPTETTSFGMFYTATVQRSNYKSDSHEKSAGPPSIETLANLNHKTNELAHSIHAAFGKHFPGNQSQLAVDLTVGLSNYTRSSVMDGDIPDLAQYSLSPYNKTYSASLSSFYKLKFGELAMLRVGLDGDYNLLLTSADYFTSPPRSNAWTLAESYPKARLQRQIYGAYSEAEFYPSEQLALSAGLRYEFNNTQINYQNSPILQNSHLPFGSFGISYNPLKWLQTSLSYSGRISRPDMSAFITMPSFSDFVNERFVPNPNLKDVYSHSVEFDAQQSFKYISFRENVRYIYDLNPFYYASFPDPAGGGKWLRSIANMKWAQTIQGTLSISSRPIEQLSLFLYGAIWNSQFHDYDGKSTRGGKVAGLTAFSVAVYLPKGFTITSNFKWIAPQPSAFRNELAHYYLSAAIYYQPIKSLSIAISADNLLDQPWQLYTTRDGAGRETLWSFNWRPRSFYLSIHWRIGKKFYSRMGESLRTEHSIGRD